MSRRPVVALVCDAIHPFSHGGREVRYHELTTRLAETIEFHVYTMHWWDGPRVYTENGITFHAISPLLPLYKKDRRSVGQALFFAFACFRLLGAEFDVLDADHMPYFQVFTLRIVAWLKRRPLVVTWHEVWSRSYWRDYLGLVGMVGWAVESLAMRLPDQIIAASPHTAERLRNALGSRAAITTIPNGIDLDGIRVVHPEAEPSDLIVVGRLMDHKRVDMLLDAVGILHAQGMPVTCRVIGDGPARSALYERARDLGVAHAVEFRHDVGEQKEIYALVKAARVFVSPSAREGFGIAILEALACGVAVITTSDPDNLSQHLAVRSGRGVVCTPTAEDLASSIWRVLARSDQLPYEEPNYDSWLADYGWHTLTGRIADLYMPEQAQ